MTRVSLDIWQSEAGVYRGPFFSSWKQCVVINMREVFPGKLYSYQLKLKKDSTEESFCYDNIYDRLQTSGNSGDMYINL